MCARVVARRSGESSPSTMRRSVSSSICFTEARPHRAAGAEQEHAGEVRSDPERVADLLVAHVGVVAEDDGEAGAVVELGESTAERIPALDGENRFLRSG